MPCQALAAVAVVQGMRPCLYRRCIAPAQQQATVPRRPARLQLLPCVSCKPPRLQLHGHQRLWGWLLPVFKVSDEELVRSAGLDALIAVRGRPAG